MGLRAWRWLFIIEGVITIFIAFGAYFDLPNFPRTTKWLTEEERDVAVGRLQEDIGTDDWVNSQEQTFWHGFILAFKDIKMWILMVMLFGIVASASVTNFFPTVVETLNYGTVQTLLLTAPPYVLAAIWMYGCAVFGDKKRIRGPLIIVNGCICMIGLGLLGFLKGNGVRYFGVFLATTACNANVPCILTFQANNIRGQWKRALCSATLVGAGGIGGIIGSTVFREQDKPGYRPGMYATLIASALIVLITCALEFKFWRANKRAAAGGKVIEGLAGFRYTL